MGTVAIVFLSLIAVPAAIVFGTDFFFYLKDRYCRFHIGRWNDRGQWTAAVERIAVKWLKHTPTVKITDNSRYILLDMLSGKYRSHTIQSWQKAALILGLLENGSPEGKQAAEKAAAALLDQHGQWKITPTNVDCGMLSFAVLKATDDPMRVKPAMDKSLSIILKNINSDGMVSYTGGRDNPEMYVDTLGLVCPFLAKYAAAYDAPEYQHTAFHQLSKYHTFGLLADTNLPNHAVNIQTQAPLGVFGWGRGTAWYLMGLMDTYDLLTDEAIKEQLRAWICDAAESYQQYQRKDGGFGATLQRMQTYDSSATAALAWFYRQCADLLENPEYGVIADACIKKLMKVTRITGKIDWCQGDTKGIGIFAQTYDIMPFAQGMAMRAL